MTTTLDNLLDKPEYKYAKTALNRWKGYVAPELKVGAWLDVLDALDIALQIIDQQAKELTALRTGVYPGDLPSAAPFRLGDIVQSTVFDVAPGQIVEFRNNAIGICKPEQATFVLVKLDNGNMEHWNMNAIKSAAPAVPFKMTMMQSRLMKTMYDGHYIYRVGLDNFMWFDDKFSYSDTLVVRPLIEQNYLYEEKCEDGIRWQATISDGAPDRTVPAPRVPDALDEDNLPARNVTFTAPVPSPDSAAAKVKLSKAQQAVVDRLKAGWTITAPDNETMTQWHKPGSMPIHRSSGRIEACPIKTLYALSRMGIVQWSGGWWKLTNEYLRLLSMHQR